jgi:probable phosphoglycerate mutase
MRELFLVRHGQSEQETGELTGGWTDTPLTQLGKAQAHRIALRLKELLSETEVTIFSSDLARSAQTASILANDLRAQAKLREDLREMNNGRAAGLTREEAKELLLPQTDPFADWRPYPEAESWRMMVERIFSRLRRRPSSWRMRAPGSRWCNGGSG